MTYIIVGLGNPGPEYENTRHNAGRIVLAAVAKASDAGDFIQDKKSNALRAEAKIGKSKAILIMPEGFMNNSGKSLSSLIKSKKAAEDLVVIYDDFNLPLGRMKISFNRGDGGHNGLASVTKHVKTPAFIRFRIGTAPATAKGTAKTPHGEDKVLKFILGKFKPEELKALNKVAKNAAEAVEMIVAEGREKAMSVFNGA